MMSSQAIPAARRRLPRTWRGRVLLALGLASLALLVTLNAGGYRYGVGDQAFYLPAVEDALDPALFPHDQPLLDAQDGLEVFDELSAAASPASGLSRGRARTGAPPRHVRGSGRRAEGSVLVAIARFTSARRPTARRSRAAGRCAAAGRRSTGRDDGSSD